MNRLSTFLGFLKAWHAGEYIGDAVILKLATFGGFEPTEQARRIVSRLSRQVPDFSAVDFGSFATGTLGREYAEFMRRNDLEVFRFSGAHLDLLEQNFLGVWYAAVHDLIHVLTGYETDLAGEAGVWAFVAGQNLSSQAPRAVGLARGLFPLVRPTQAKKIWAAIDEGLENGRRATSILEIDFAAGFSQPLSEVRKSYAIVPSRAGACST